MLAQHGSAQGIGMVMLHQTKVRVDVALESGSFFMIRFVPLRYTVIRQQSAVKVAFGAIYDIDSPWLDDNAEVVDPLRVMLKENFMRVKR